MEKSIWIVATLLVATVTGQSLWEFDEDVPTLASKWEPRGRRLLGHPLERFLIYGQSLKVPSYLQDDIFDVSTLQIEDVINHPLFPVYMGFPYFRQYWSYPMFQRYVCSQYFQRFWDLPAFHQYFVSPVLFYKYIYPLVTVFKYDCGTTRGYPYVTTTDLPTLSYGYECQQQGQDYAQEVHYKALLGKIVNRLYNSQQQQNTQDGLQNLITNIQLAPEGVLKHASVEKIVDPTSNNRDIQVPAEYATLVDTTRVPVEVDDATTVLPEQKLKNTPTTVHEDNIFNYYNPIGTSFNPFVARMFKGHRFGGRFNLLNQQ